MPSIGLACHPLLLDAWRCCASPKVYTPGNPGTRPRAGTSPAEDCPRMPPGRRSSASGRADDVFPSLFATVRPPDRKLITPVLDPEVKLEVNPLYHMIMIVTVRGNVLYNHAVQMVTTDAIGPLVMRRAVRMLYLVLVLRWTMMARTFLGIGTRIADEPARRGRMRRASARLRLDRGSNSCHFSVQRLLRKEASLTMLEPLTMNTVPSSDTGAIVANVD